VVCGAYGDASFRAHGFVRATGGTITGFEAPGAGRKVSQGTFALTLNDAGDIVGFLLDAGSVFHGFVRTA
jgi:hypothetical protein